MFPRNKTARWVLGTAAGLAAAALALWLLRWPLFEGRIRRELSRLARERLGADLEVGRLRGNLLFSLTAEDVALLPGPESPLREGSARSVSVRYGLLGTGKLEVEAAGVRVSAAAARAPGPVHETVREVAGVLRSIEFPGRLRVEGLHVTLADGRRVEAESASLDGGHGAASMRVEGFGNVAASFRREPPGGFVLEARADGPLKEARIHLEGAAGPEHPLRVEALFEEHRIAWTGRAFFDAAGRLERADGRLEVKEGRADTRVDFLAGRAAADLDATVALGGEFKADVVVTLRGGGPLAGPPEAWVVEDGLLRAGRAAFRGLEIDGVEVTLGRGTLRGIPWRASARAGRDRIEAEGRFRWDEGPEVEAALRASAADAAPYLKLAGVSWPLRAADLRADGRAVYGKAGLSFDGALEGGPGSFEGYGWTSFRAAGAYGPERVAVREFTLRGTPFAPEIQAEGSLGSRALQAQASAGPDRAWVEAALGEGSDFEADFRAEGPLAWLRAFQAALPGAWQPVRARGRLSRKGDELGLGFDFETKDGLAGAPRLAARRKGGAWLVEVAPGAIASGGRPLLEHGRFSVELRPGAAALAGLRVAWLEPAHSAALSGRVRWDEREAEAVLDLSELAAWGVTLEALSARLKLDRVENELRADVRWGEEGGDHFIAAGRIGKENDFRLSVAIRDLGGPVLRRALAGAEVQGRVAGELRLTGSREKPELAGNFSIDDFSLFGAPPLTLEVPLRSEAGVLEVRASAERTAYGTLTLRGRVPLADLGPKTPVDLTARLEARDFTPFLDRLPEDARRWVPPGRLVVEGTLRGPIERLDALVAAEFTAPKWRPPRPLGVVADLRVVGRWDGRGRLWLDALEGRMGDGPFRAQGHWDPLVKDRPLVLEVRGEEALVVDEDLVRVRVSPQATFRYSDRDGMRLEGRVEVPLAFYHREFAAPRAAPEPARKREVRPPRLQLAPHPAGGFRIGGLEGLEGVALDLEFLSTGELRLENSVVGLLLRAEGHLGGTAAEPALSGTLRARRGEVRLATGVFVRSESAEAVLPREAGAAARVRFEGTVGKGEGAITVLLAGPLERPTLTLRSDPPRSEEDLKAILAFGAAPGTLSGQAAIGTLAQQVLAQYRDDAPAADRKEGILQKFNLVVVPEEAPGQRRPWELPVAGTARGTVLRTEYVYNAYLSILGESDREGNVSGDVKLRIRF